MLHIHLPTHHSLRAFIALLVGALLLAPALTMSQEMTLEEVIGELSSYEDRSSGTPGSARAASFIQDYLSGLGLAPQTYYFPIPVREVRHSSITVGGKTVPLQPLMNNAVTPQATDGLLSGPLYWVDRGNLKDFDRKQIKDAILLMDFNSGGNWLTAASLGARAVIFVDHQITRANIFYQEKEELSPIQFPCFWMTDTQATELFGSYREAPNGLVSDTVSLSAQIVWKNVLEKNIYCLIEGRDPTLSKQLVIIEAFYDSTAYVAGRSPGADESISIATMLKLAEHFSRQPPSRSFLFVATSGHAQSLHGMRDLIWSMKERTKLMRDQRRDLKKQISRGEETLELLSELSFPLSEDAERDAILAEAINNDLRFGIDNISKQLMNLRMGQSSTAIKEQINLLADRRFAMRRLGWAISYHDLPSEEQQILEDLLPQVDQTLRADIEDSQTQITALESALDFRQLTRDFNEIGAIISLHLSSHGIGVGGFNRGWLYLLRPRINRTGMFSVIGDVFENATTASYGTARYVDSLRPNRLRTWDSYFLDRPFLGGEVSSLAGFIGVTLATIGDGRTSWGTPWDTAERIDKVYIEDQLALLTDMLEGVSVAKGLHSGIFPRMGYSSVTGTSNLLLHGELFANYPTTDTVLLSYQGIAKLYGWVNRDGTFLYKGISDKKNVFDKLIIEGYRFDQKTGQVIWAIDKKETTKTNYRVKIVRNAMKTRLIMFPSRQTTIFDLLEPRSLDHMTKLYLFDGRRDATPQRYWYSRIDTRESIISSIYLAPGSYLKLTLSDNVLTPKLILSNGSMEKPLGTGYPVDEYPQIINTMFHSAKDFWSLLTPRIINLESHGIYDDRINALKARGLTALAESSRHLEELNYTAFREAASESLALAARVYTQIEKTQKDVLFGVLFYIALFVPFAFCMERFLFGYANIYKRITAFSLILVALILVIYNVHPAFEMAYSPMVVILAFFIIGLSFMVTLIIFFRFEEEMILLQRHASHMSAAEISRWKAFVAAFFLGVSNLRRRKIRTILTSSTLIILTFTIMSFTTVKSNVQENRLFFKDDAPYQGLLLQRLNWRSLPTQATEILENSMQGISVPAPRIWLDAPDPTRTIQVPLRNQSQRTYLEGLVGLSPNEATVTGIDRLLSAGRWFTEDDHNAIIISDSTASELGITTGNSVELWGTPFEVIGTFPGAVLDTTMDLNGEPLTPVTFPRDQSGELSDIEQEAIESGEDIRSFQGRYTHIPASVTGFVPADTLLAMGGSLKNVAVSPESDTDINEVAAQLVDRFGLAIFTGDQDGVWLYNLSDTIAYSGVPNIIIPLLISILIVLNTMISSVYERKNEIGIYTSVGLAPSHVGFLFVAEAMALAVISVVLGYLLAQVSAALLSGTSFWEGITVNYSSTAGVAAMVLVIAVVLISVIYPSRVAARIAIPDVNRSFELPDTDGNSLQVYLPFFMKHAEYKSIGGFLYNYFVGHQDISHGRFSTGQVDLVYSCENVAEIQQRITESQDHEDYHCVHLQARVWLAPFDFGIMQLVDIQFYPARDNPAFLEVKMTIHRESGEESQWRRINKIFIHQLRKQLLIWRSMDHLTHAQLSNDFQSISDTLAPA
ncbi:MAG: peptide ABC transporter permease [Desulfofustis sp.]|nr:peptide ABC transporter permease [Desulfofustis sp.]